MKPQRRIIKILNQHIRQLRNKRGFVSIQEIAHDANMEASQLALILAEKKSLPLDDVDQLIKVLQIDDVNSRILVHEIVSSSIKSLKFNSPALRRYTRRNLSNEIVEDANDTLSVSAEELSGRWETHAVINLIDSVEFEADPLWIAKRLNISFDWAIVIWTFLQDNELINIEIQSVQ